MKNRVVFWCTFFYAIVIFLMGISATNSKISQYMSIVFGIALMICAFLLYSDYKWSLPLILFLSAVLATTFIVRYALTGKLWAATMALLSGAMFLLVLVRLVRWRK